MYTLNRTLPTTEAASLWRESASAYGGLHPGEINADALAAAATEQAVVDEVERAWLAVPEADRCNPYPAQAARLSGGYADGVVRLTYGGGRSTVTLQWVPGAATAELVVAWVPTLGRMALFGCRTAAEAERSVRSIHAELGSDPATVEAAVERALERAAEAAPVLAREQALRDLHPRTTWEEFKPRLAAAGFALIDLMDARRDIEVEQSVHEHAVERAMRYVGAGAHYQW
jgi:hypothetical protein